MNGVEYAYTNAAGFTTSDGDFQRFTDWINLNDKSVTANAFANDVNTQNEVLAWLNTNKDFGKNYSLSVAIDAGSYSSTWYEALVAPIKPLSPGVYKSSTSTSSQVESPIGYTNPFDLNYTPTNFIGSLTTQSTCGETLQIEASLTQTCVEEYGLVYSLTDELPAVEGAEVTKQEIWSGNATDFENEAFDYTANVVPENEFKDHYVRTYYLQNVSGTYFYVYSPLITAMPLDPDLDCDGDGITNGQELDTEDPNKDTDGDGTPDYRDEDSNNDGVTDSENTGEPDCDEDGIKDFQDLSYDPEIQSQSANITICDLTDASFGVTATGGGLSYHWQADDGSGFADLANSDIYSNVTTSTLNITGATQMDGFQYRCVINSSSCNTSSTSDIATVSINIVNPPVTNDVYYNLNEPASAISSHISGDNLTYYDAESGGTGVVHEITPSTNNVGSTEYWVSQTVDGCESARTKVTVAVKFPYEIEGSNDSKSSLFAINSKVDESVNVTGSGDITDPKVYISLGYQLGDKLITGMDLPSGITAAFDASNGNLNFTGTASTAVWQELFRNVMFSSSSSNTDNRTIAFILENSISLKVDDKNHYYQYVSGANTWAQAKTAAEAMTFLGMQGYLASVTSRVENDFIEDKLASDGWIGGSDDYNYINAAAGSALFADQGSAEGKWYWVTGPEKGQAISIGNNTPSAVDGAFMNWNPNEPNNSSGEHYMQLYSTLDGKWNDLNGTISLDGFVVEYGGNDDEGDPNIQHSRIISFNAEADLTISVNDIDENSAIGTVIDSLTLNGIDEGTDFTFTLVSGSGDTDNNLFIIKDGELVTASSFDYELKSGFSIRVQAQDEYGATYEKVLTITVNNLNDNAPVITESQSFTLDENTANNTYIGQILAADADAGTVLQNWEILSGNIKEAFQIDANTGELSVKNHVALDFEAIESFTLELSVTDGDLVSEVVIVTIHLTNLNDTAPVITESMSFSIAENLPNGTEVGEITASDLDANTSFVDWKIISGNTQNAFNINAKTGLLEVNNSNALDYELIKEFTIGITVSDGENTSEARLVTINIENVNDNQPTDLSLSNNILSENVEVGNEVGFFTTADADSEDHFTYQLVSGEGDDDNDFFQIIENELFTKKTLDYDYNRSLKLRVRTEDNGGNALENSFVITVNANMEMELSIPTAFTPNGDGKNDTWEIDRMTNYPQCTIRVFNTDGIEVFQNAGYTQQWDGYHKGKLMSIGNYYYIIQLNDNSGKVHKGSVMIIK